ncbi:sugar phosphate isomerase [Adhaeribacter aerolatus]|uniref:Sugar phosphate isomerase n=1 Tax=Adhaeribacter aerolatus TaxID=670289 RepID=A0A512AVJ9_9BACT|nr:sugar phosphate isomerase/epimerase [Adhaeribacter aerolatus]GEO03734.1 sugar phosphate isomerase [Adhaeribacter aerolatus]
MISRREFLKTAGTLTLSACLLPDIARAALVKNPGIQVYSVKKEITEDAVGTLKKLAQIGYKEIETAGKAGNYYYGLKPKEINKICRDLGMRVRSGHVHINENWQQTIDNAGEAGQQYIICSSMPSREPSISNYQRTAEGFNKAAEACKKANIVFGYHNHEYEFEKKDGKILYDVLLQETDADLVKMELDLGWVAAAGLDPFYYFEKYPDRFPLWHLKDIKKTELKSTELGTGRLDIKRLFQKAEKSGMKYFFVEQEDFTTSPLAAAEYNLNYLKGLNY